MRRDLFVVVSLGVDRMARMVLAKMQTRGGRLSRFGERRMMRDLLKHRFVPHCLLGQSSMPKVLSVFYVSVFTLLGSLAPSSVSAQAPTEIGKNHLTVRRELVPIVARANRSVVRVFSGRRQADVALGVIVSADGYVLTKASELQESVECLLPTTQREAAQIVATDETHDLALLKVSAQGLVPIEWAFDAGIEAGELIAIPGRGNAPLSVGIIGGGLGSVPPTQGVLGVVVRQVDGGPKITQVMPGSVAARSGLLVGDRVTHVGRRRVAACRDLAGFVNQFEPGQLFSLTIVRGDSTLAIKTGLDKRAEAVTGSGLDRDVPSAVRVPLSNRRGGFPRVFPHDAYLRPNDCGGPLVNLKGAAIGLNIARADRATSYALPAAIVKAVQERLMPAR